MKEQIAQNFPHATSLASFAEISTRPKKGKGALKKKKKNKIKKKLHGKKANKRPPKHPFNVQKKRKRNIFILNSKINFNQF